MLLDFLKTQLWRGLTWFARKRTTSTTLVLVVVVVGVGLLLPEPASALVDVVGNWIITAIANVLLFFASIIGRLTLLLIALLVDVAQFNNFIDAPAVAKGWVIVRDVCNMFFIVILLLIAFGSVFHIEEYQYKKILGKLLIMAVLINFSKSIAGFFIDIAQVVMLTFVNGFKEAAAGNFVNGFHIAKMFTFAEEQGQTGTGTLSEDVSEVNETSYLGAAALALVTIIITAIVVAVYLIVFLLRIIALWFLVIISPIAYALSAFPGDAKKYSSMWWDYFGRYATTGPILAFFLWLSLAVMQTTSNVTEYGFKTTGESQPLITTSPPAAITQIGQADILLSFIINIMLLMGGLWMTQQLGVAGGKLAATAMNKIQGAGAAIARSPWRATKALSTSVNQSLVKATGVSLDPRDYVKAYQTARDARRKEAYQGFYGPKAAWFKKWASPQGVIKGVVGAIPRRKGATETSENEKKISELKEQQLYGNKSERYRDQLNSEKVELEEEKARNDEELSREGTPETDRQRIKLRNDEIGKRLNEIGDQSKVGTLLNLDDAALGKKYDEALQKDIDKLEKKEKGYQTAGASGNPEDILKVRVEEIADDIDLINYEIDKDQNQLDALMFLRQGKRMDNAALDAKRIALVGQSATVNGRLGTIDGDIAAAEVSKDWQLADKLKAEKGDLQYQKALIEQVQLPFVKMLTDINDNKVDVKSKKQDLRDNNVDLKQVKLEKEEKLRERESRLKADPKSDVTYLDRDIEALTSKEKALNTDNARLEKEIEKAEEGAKKLEENRDRLVGSADPAEEEALQTKIIEAKQQEAVKEQEKNKFDVSRLSKADVVIIADEIKEGWDKISKQSKEQREKLTKQINTKQMTREERVSVAKEVNILRNRIDEIKGGWYQPKETADYFIEQERRSDVAEELKKITTENPEELIAETKKAVSAGNKARTKALIMKLTHDYNLNELMNGYANILTETKGKSNFQGLNEFRKKVLQGQLGLDEQEALQFQNDVSYGAEGVGHWASARTVGYDVANEKYYELSEEEHTKIALAEIMKMQPRQVVSSINRLGYGGEVVMPDGSMKFDIDKLGQAIAIAAQNVIAKEIGHMQVNAATNLSQPQVLAVLQQLVNQGKLEANVLRQIQGRVAKGAERGPAALVDFLMGASK